jgi:hypothetical protein
MNMYREYLMENLRGRDDVEDKKVNGRIILKYIFKEQFMTM